MHMCGNAEVQLSSANLPGNSESGLLLYERFMILWNDEEDEISPY